MWSNSYSMKPRFRLAWTGTAKLTAVGNLRPLVAQDEHRLRLIRTRAVTLSDVRSSRKMPQAGAWTQVAEIDSNAGHPTPMNGRDEQKNRDSESGRRPWVEVDCNGVLETALGNLEGASAESK